jgi:hypothetical protein
MNTWTEQIAAKAAEDLKVLDSYLVGLDERRADDTIKPVVLLETRPAADKRPMRGAFYDARVGGWVLIFDGNYLGTYMGGSAIGARTSLSQRSRHYGLRPTGQPVQGEQDRSILRGTWDAIDRHHANKSL